MKFLKTTRGNYRCYYKGYYIFVFTRPHGGWAALVNNHGENEPIDFPFNGYHTRSMPTLKHVREWIKTKIG